MNVGENHSNHFYNYKQDEIPYNGTLDIENVIEPRVKSYEMRMCTVYTVHVIFHCHFNRIHSLNRKTIAISPVHLPNIFGFIIIIVEVVSVVICRCCFDCIDVYCLCNISLWLYMVVYYLIWVMWLWYENTITWNWLPHFCLTSRGKHLKKVLLQITCILYYTESEGKIKRKREREWMKEEEEKYGFKSIKKLIRVRCSAQQNERKKIFFSSKMYLLCCSVEFVWLFRISAIGIKSRLFFIYAHV